jgi:hypothetical protein
MTPDPRLVSAILRSDFYSFVQAIFPIVSPNAAFAPNWHIEAIAYALTRVLKGEIKRLIITLPPRGLKSICASVAFPAFVLGHDPTKRIICVSYSEGLACKHANDCRAVMRSGLYRRLFPNACISSTKNTELEFATTRGGNRLATSVGGTLTGRGGNFVAGDCGNRILGSAWPGALASAQVGRPVASRARAPGCIGRPQAGHGVHGLRCPVPARTCPGGGQPHQMAMV